ncbi:MAG: hypothetical protein K2K83_02230, partial [Rikenella sp.]|nr:hypothetical protein [Rikenella sp.]
SWNAQHSRKFFWFFLFTKRTVPARSQTQVIEKTERLKVKDPVSIRRKPDLCILEKVFRQLSFLQRQSTIGPLPEKQAAVIIKRRIKALHYAQSENVFHSVLFPRAWFPFRIEGITLQR